MTILLSTLNARYAHASLGLRYLLANMGELQEQTSLMEFVIGAKTVEVVERSLRRGWMMNADGKLEWVTLPKKIFEHLPRRWVVERTFGWFGLCRRLSVA